MTESEWRVLAAYATGFEADLAMAQLKTARIPAIRDSHELVGIFRSVTGSWRGRDAGRRRGPRPLPTNVSISQPLILSKIKPVMTVEVVDIVLVQTFQRFVPQVLG